MELNFLDMSLVKWVGIGTGWFFGGPIGAIIGYYISKSFFNGKNDHENAYEISLLILSSLVQVNLTGELGLSLLFPSISQTDFEFGTSIFLFVVAHPVSI